MVAPKRRNGAGEGTACALAHLLGCLATYLRRPGDPSNPHGKMTFIRERNGAVANNVWLEHRRTITNHTFLQALILMEPVEHAGVSCLIRFYFLVFPTNLAAQE